MKIKNGKTKPRININAFGLYVKNTGNKKRFEIHDIFDDYLLLEKYNQTRQSKIIIKIVGKQEKDLKKVL